MLTLPTRHSEYWLNRPTARPPEPFVEQQLSWIAPTFQLRCVERGNAPRHSLLFFSDLHWPPTAPAAYQTLANAINELQPEWIVSGGDLHTFLAGQEDALPLNSPSAS